MSTELESQRQEEMKSEIFRSRRTRRQTEYLINNNNK